MIIDRITAYSVENVPVETPPFRSVPNTASAILIEVVTDEGIVGWSRAGHSHPIVVDFINKYLAKQLIGEDVFQINRTKNRLAMALGLGARKAGLYSMYRGAWSSIDIALWDIKGQFFGKPVHELLGGARTKVPVYITFGVAYGDEPEYGIDELVAEAKHWVALGNTGLKTVVGQKVRGQIVEPDSRADRERLEAVRDAIGPDVHLAVDGALGMSLSESIHSCRAIEELGIAFIEEPVYDNDPELLSQLRRNTAIPIAVAETSRYSARDLLVNRAVDILQPNVNNDGGYTGGAELAAIARMFNVPIGHGNGSGPYNLALQAGVENGTEIEYHQLRWFQFNAMFDGVAQPENGFLHVSDRPGTGLIPKDGLIREFAVAV